MAWCWDEDDDCGGAGLPTRHLENTCNHMPGNIPLRERFEIALVDYRGNIGEVDYRNF